MGTLTATTAGLRPHRFLARTFSAARWSEYDMLLSAAVEMKWVPMDLERWITAGGIQGRVLILRHDVDQHPATAVRMAWIEARHGLRATWYFRWRTSSPLAIKRIRELGGGVGLHYETLTRLMLERGLSAADLNDQLIEEARGRLSDEVTAFQNRFGEIHSICAHGDTRVPGVSNQALMRGVEPSLMGIGFDAGEALARLRLGLWMTDRTSSEGRWKEGADPLVMLGEGEGPILCLTHPNNWCSGVSLWSDRVRAAAFRGQPARAGERRLRTGDDRPAMHHLHGRATPRLVERPQLRPAPAVRPFAPIALTMRREIVRHYYDSGAELTSDAGLRTLDTNSALAETRATTLERALACAHVPSVRGRDLVDLGCGFGALTLVFAARGARVTGLDPNSSRMEVGARVAHEYALPVRWIAGGMDVTDLGEEQFDIAVMNNSLCYLVDWSRRLEALRRTLAALRPGGVLVIRNPKRIQARDQFTHVPLLGTLPPGAASRISQTLSLERSHVRLLTSRAARRELRRAGFVEVFSVPGSGRSSVLDALGAYQHLIARRPAR
jgi:2-polyprenyl-3-methyl-5-hydroxy-6-metoxy-1,4-benzoquinol methylase